MAPSLWAVSNPVPCIVSIGLATLVHCIYNAVYFLRPHQFNFLFLITNLWNTNTNTKQPKSGCDVFSGNTNTKQPKSGCDVFSGNTNTKQPKSGCDVFSGNTNTKQPKSGCDVFSVSNSFELL